MTSDTLIPIKCTVSIIHIHLMRISYRFRCWCTIIRGENYATYWKNQLLL